MASKLRHLSLLFARVVLLGLFLTFCLPVLAQENLNENWGAKKLCSTLGAKEKKYRLDIDSYTFEGKKGEKVIITLDADPSGSHTGENATLLLTAGATPLLKVDRSSIPNKISTVLPATGKYFVYVIEQFRTRNFNSLRGSYCLTLESSQGAWGSFESLGSAYLSKHPIAWAPEKLEETVSKGSHTQLQVAFISRVDLKKANLWVTPELRPFLRVEPNYFEKIEANTPYEVDLDVTVPWDATPGHYDGTIHLRVGSRTYPQTLKVMLHVVERVNQPPVANAGPDRVMALPEGQITMDVQLDGSGSYDPDGTLASYIWTGTLDPEDVVNPIVTLKQGIYDFTLQVTDDKGASSSDSVKITVVGPPFLRPLPDVIGEQAITLKGISLPGATILLTNKTSGETKEVLNEKGLFEVPFSLTQGQNEFEAIAIYEGVQSAPAKLKTTYTSTRNLVLQEISPSSGQSGSIITLTGSGFTPDPAVMGVHFIGQEIEGTGSRLEGKGIVLEATQTALKVVVPFIFLKSEEDLEVYVYDGQTMSNFLSFRVVPALDPTPDIKGNEVNYQLDLLLTQLQHIFDKLEQWTKPNVPPETWPLIEENIRRTRYFLETFKERVNSIPSEEVRANLDAIFGSEFFSHVAQQLEQANEIISHTTGCDIQRVIDILNDILQPIDEINRILDRAKGIIIILNTTNSFACIFLQCYPCCALVPVLHEIYSTVAAIDSVIDAIREVLHIVIDIMRGALPTIPSEWKVFIEGPFPGISNHILYTNTSSKLTLFANFTNHGFEPILSRIRREVRIDIPDPFGIFHLLGNFGIYLQYELERYLGRLLFDLAIDLLDIDQITITITDIKLNSTIREHYDPDNLLLIQAEGQSRESHTLVAGASAGSGIFLDIQASCQNYSYPERTKCLDFDESENRCKSWGTDYPRYFEMRVIDRPMFSGTPSWVIDEKCYDVVQCYDWERREHICSIDQYRQYINTLCLASGRSQDYCDEEICYDRSSNSYDPMCNLDLYYADLNQWCERMPERCEQLIPKTRICQEYGHWHIPGLGFSTQMERYCTDIEYRSCYDQERKTHICNLEEYENIILNICRGQENPTCESLISHCCLQCIGPPSCNRDELLVALLGVCWIFPERCDQYMRIVHHECSDGPFLNVYWNGSLDTGITGGYRYDSFNLFSTPGLPSLKPGWLSVGVVDMYGNERKSDEIFVGPSPNLNAEMEVLNGGFYPGETLYIAGNFFSTRLSDNKLTIFPPQQQSVSLTPSSGSVGLYTKKDIILFENMGDFGLQDGAVLNMRLKVGEHLPCGSNNCDEKTVSLLPYQEVKSGRQRSILHGGAGTDYVRSAAIGDLNGDGINDLVVGVTDYKDDNVGYSTGAVFIKFGPIGGITGIEWGGKIQSIDFSHPEGGWDVKIMGDPDDRHEGNNTRRIGNSIAIGDVDGDGIADLIIGTTDQDEDGNHTPNVQWTPVSEPGHVPGKVYIFYGKRGNWERVYRLGDGQYDLRIYGDEEDAVRELGYQVAVGRFFCDESLCPELHLVITAPTNPNKDLREGKTGRVYILGGFHKGLPKEIRTDQLSNYLRVTRIESKGVVERDVKIIDQYNFETIDYIGDGLGKSIAVGDINGDGLDDILLGAPHYSRLGRVDPLELTQGAVYVLFGSIGLANYIVADPEGMTFGGPRVITGPKILVESMSRTGFGSSVAIVDLDNDGKGEIIIGAPRSDLKLTIYADPTLSDSEQNSISKKESWIGSVYVIDGSKISNFTRASIDSISDLFIHGSKTMSLFGYSLAGGDVNNDGIKDLLVGAPGKPLSGVPGRVWVLLGSREPKWRLTEGFDTIHLKHRRWYVTSTEMIFHPKNPNTKIEEGIDSVFIGDVNSVDRMGFGFGINIVVGDLDPFVGDDVVILDRFGKGPQQGDWSMGPGAAYVFYQVGELLPLTIYPETVNIPYCNSEQRFTVVGGLMPYQFKWESCYQTYVGQPPVQFPGPIVCGEDFSLPSNFEVTYGENSVLLRINGCVPNDLMSLSLKVTDSAIPRSSATREITFLKPDISVSPLNINIGEVSVG